MAKVHKTYPSPYNGISEQVDELMIDSQCKDMVNCIPDLIQGLSKRPPAIYITRTEGGLLPNAPLGHYPLYVDALDYQGTNDGIEYSMANNGTPASVLVYDGTKAYFNGYSFVKTLLPYSSTVQSASVKFTVTGHNPGDWMGILHWSSTSAPASNLLVLAVFFDGNNQPYLVNLVSGSSQRMTGTLVFGQEYEAVIDSLGRVYLDGELVITNNTYLDLSQSNRFVIGCDVDPTSPIYNDGFIGYISDVYLFEGGLTP